MPQASNMSWVLGFTWQKRNYSNIAHVLGDLIKEEIRIVFPLLYFIV